VNEGKEGVTAGVEGGVRVWLCVMAICMDRCPAEADSCLTKERRMSIQQTTKSTRSQDEDYRLKREKLC